MNTEAATAGPVEQPEEAPEATIRTVLDFPKDVLDWLELEALIEKQRTGRRMAKSPIAVRILRAEMLRQQRERQR